MTAMLAQDQRAEGRSACSSCGATVGGRTACQALFDELNALAWRDAGRAAVHNLAVDAYAMQHPEDYCKSPKSYAAHLTGLCCAREFGARSDFYRVIARWLDGKVELQKPSLVDARGTVTIADVRAVSSEEYAERVRMWAGAVWDAYASQHDLARAWMKAAIGGSSSAIR
jgi:hypothetical protein